MLICQQKNTICLFLNTVTLLLTRGTHTGIDSQKISQLIFESVNYAYRYSSPENSPIYINSLLLYCAIATVFQLYIDGDMMYEMRRKPKPTLLLTQRIFNLPYPIGTV